VVALDIPVVEVDQSVNENSTNPVSGKGVSAELKRFGSTYGTALQLNEIGEGDDKAYSVSLLNEQGDVISTTDQFTGGGGGGSVSATKVVLTRITPNRTVKKGDKVELAYKYDQIDTTTGESTGNPGRATVTITSSASSYPDCKHIRRQHEHGRCHVLHGNRYEYRACTCGSGRGG
jgi:hypothetical protein